jgi:hypothetical protein
MRRIELIPFILIAVMSMSCNQFIDSTGSGVGEALILDEDAQQRRIEDFKASAAHGTPELWVAGRTELADCAGCHKKDTAAVKPNTDPEGRAAHWDVKLNHAEGMDCRTCHVPTEPAKLKLLESHVDIDEAYRSCATCHRKEVADWRGGAHGKRLSGWVEPRVVKNCAGCHDPHKPHLEKRMPVAYPTIVPDRLKPRN